MKTHATGRLLLHSIFRRGRMILGLLVSILGTILLGSLLVPPRYEASSSVIIRGRNYDNLVFHEARRGGQATVLMNPKEEINSEIEIIRSRPVLERVVDSLKLHTLGEHREPGFWGNVRSGIQEVLQSVRNPLVAVGVIRELSGQDAFEAAVERLDKQLKVDPSSESQIVRIVYRHSDPAMASQVVNKTAEEYLKQHLTINLNRAGSSFFAEQIKTAEGELAALQDQLAKLKSEGGIVAFAIQSKTLVEKLHTFDLAQVTAQKEIISKQSKVQRIQSLRKSNPDLLIPLPEMAQDVQISDLENKLINLRYELETVRLRYTDDSRQVATIREQIIRLKSQIRGQVNNLLDREVAELRKLQAEEQALGQMVRRQRAELKEIPAKEMALANLEKQVEDKQAALSELRKRHQDSLAAQATDSRLENAKIVSLASPPLRPASPNLPLNLALGLILGLVVSFSAAFFVEYWDDSLKVPEDVERYLGLPVFASIPEL